MLSAVDKTDRLQSQVNGRTDELFRDHQSAIHVWMDRLFAWLMAIQWLAGIAAAYFVSPLTWNGANSETHVHVWAAVLLGGAITGLPLYFALVIPGRAVTRYTIAIGQVLMSALLIHLTGGRIETHFHVFGSLALLACYRDARVLVAATIVVVLDHWIRGVYWPESVYGVLTTTSWRFLEHAGWVIFEDVCLLITIRYSVKEMKHIARQRAQLESTNARIEAEVERRTRELHVAMQELEASNQSLEIAVDQLAEKNSELDQFAYVASHDLQEPVRKMVSFSKLLQQDVDGELNGRAAQDLEFIVDAAKRLQALIQDLLALSRAGRTAMRSDAVCLDEVVDDALFALQLQIEESGAEIARDPLPTVTGDATMLSQLYQNLIGNGLKFVGEKQPVVRLTARRDGADWVLGVRDNGIGIASDYAERVFEPFQRLHSRGEYSGTGIGLAICRKAVQRHGGNIWVRSSPNEGACFEFTLPALESEEPKCTNEQMALEKLSSC